MSFQPTIIATWKFGEEAVRVGYPILSEGGLALDAVEAAANAVEVNASVNSVGYGGLPNAEGIVELDAAIMDGRQHSAGAVGAITDIKRPISVARMVMERTPHVMLVGANARRFALEQGFEAEELLTEPARQQWEAWKRDTSQGPDVAHFEPRIKAWSEEGGSYEQMSHDTVGICAVDERGDIAVGCTTSGMAWKVPGRVGDSPIIGSGLYLDNEVGAASATGNGDEMMKVCLSYRVVDLMAQGLHPQKACEEAIRYLIRKRSEHQGRGAAVIALDKKGQTGAAATSAGFSAPDRLWIYSYSDGANVVVREGIYVSE